MFRRTPQPDPDRLARELRDVVKVKSALAEQAVRMDELQARVERVERVLGRQGLSLGEAR